MRAVFCLLLVAVCLLDYGDAYRRKPNWGYTRKRSRFERKKVMMPSGESFYITTPILPRGEPEFKCGANDNVTAKIIYLNPNGKMGKKEYNIVMNEINKTMTGNHLFVSSTRYNEFKISKVINPCLWNRYKFSKETIRRETTNMTEMFLFHGSRSAMQLINTGFDERYSNLYGNFGAGVYFASHFAKSDYYTTTQADGYRLMLLCRVNLGKMHVVTSGGRFTNPPKGFHSVKGAWAFPEFIVYRGEQAYPEYLIQYK